MKEHFQSVSRQHRLISPPVYVIPPLVHSVYHGPSEKKNIILHVGRFFLGGHSKKQLELMSFFKELLKQPEADGWELHLAGSVASNSESLAYLARLLNEAKGFPIRIHVDPPLHILEKLYHDAAIYWHAAGWGEDANQFQEHIRITTVEAMSAGCIPIVCATDGQVEIVTHGVNGYLWESADALVQLSLNIIRDKNGPDVATLRSNARKRASDFGSQAFHHNLRELLRTYRLRCPGDFLTDGSLSSKLAIRQHQVQDGKHLHELL